MKRVLWGLSLASWMALSLTSFADDPKPNSPAKPAIKLPSQLGEDEVKPFEPARSRTVEEQNKVDANAWFLTGQISLQKENYQSALKSFEKARDLNPTNPQLHRSVFEAAMHLGLTEKAMESARKAVELDPGDVDLLRQLALEFVREDKAAEAIKYLERGLKSDQLSKKSAAYVLLNRDLAVIYNAIGEFDKAAEHFEVLLGAMVKPAEYGLNAQARQDLIKNRTTSYEEMGQAFVRAKKFDLAIQALEMAVKERRTKPSPVNLLLAQVYHEKGDYQKSLDQLDLFFKTQLKRGKIPYQLLASVLTKLGKGDTLHARLQEMVNQDPRNKDLLFFLADSYIKAKQFDQAEAIFKKSLEESVSSDAYLGLARVYRQQNKPGELLDNLARASERLDGQQEAALQTFAEELKAIAADPALFSALFDVVKERTKDGVRKEHFASAMTLAMIAAENEKVDQAIELYDIAMKANRSQSERIYMSKAEVLSTAKRYADAAAVYQAALKDPLAQGQRGTIYWRLSAVLSFAGKYEEALAAANELKKLIPESEQAQFQIGWVHYMAHKWEAARDSFEELIKKHPDGEGSVNRARMLLSNVYVNLGDTKKGEEVLEAFLADNPDDPGVNNDLGYLYADQGKNLERAKSMIEKAIKAEPKNGAYLDSMGWVLFKLGQHKEALEWLEKATSTESGGDATIWDHMGDVHLGLKDVEKARAAWEKAMKVSKESGNPDEKLQKKITEKLELHKPEKK